MSGDGKLTYRLIHLSCLFIGGMIGRGMTGTGGFAITLLEVVNLYEITMVMEEMAEPM